MQNRISKIESQRGGDPHRIDEILAELLTQYEQRFPNVTINVVETPAVTIDSLFYPPTLANLS